MSNINTGGRLFRKNRTGTVNGYSRHVNDLKGCVFTRSYIVTDLHDQQTYAYLQHKNSEKEGTINNTKSTKLMLTVTYKTKVAITDVHY